KDHAVSGTNGPAIADSVSKAKPGAEITALQIAGSVREVQHLCGEVEDGALVVNFGGWEIQGVSCADVQRETRRYLPVIPDEKLGDMSPLLNNPVLDIDRKGIDLAQ